MPILDARTVEFFTRGPEQTRRIGMRLGALLQKGDVICLSGDLGAGKTTLVQGVARGWGSLDAATSPTFILVNTYRRPDGQLLHHLDAYRMQSALEAEDLDLDLMLEQGPLVLEWPERIESAIPTERLSFQLRWMTEDQRGMVVSARGARYESMLAQLRRKIYGGS
ncbi:MAG TPA: tRNA (adenosine(37)-N6)-threonylcarbamoyltransferase complex ATPase subunit type 1 TsaE [Anaerolineaceae bacterium]